MYSTGGVFFISVAQNVNIDLLIVILNSVIILIMTIFETFVNNEGI